MEYAQMLLSRVIDDNDVAALRRHNVRESDLQTAGEKETFRFIVEYAEQNGGNAPDYRTAVAECESFIYYPQVEDSYEYLTKQIKSYAAKVQFADLIQTDVPKIFDANDGFKTIDETIERLLEIRQQTEMREKVGFDLKSDIDGFMGEYQRRKEGRSFKIWRSKFPTINKEISGYFGGNVYTWFARSGRGKSMLTTEEAIEAAFQGANVLIWAMEMSEFEWLVRAYSSLSARTGIVSAEINGITYDGGFVTRDILSGKLPDEMEAGLRAFLLKVNEMMPGNIILRAKDHKDFYNRSVKDLESDILKVKADVVVIDAIYHMDYEPNTSKTAGGDVANTCNKLNRIAGYTGAVFHIITQADEIKDSTNEDSGIRELRTPKRDEVRKTKAALEDAFNLIGIDTDSQEGRGLVEIGKGRFGGEGVQFELLYLPQIGLIKEMIESVHPSQFNP